nr:hypothetical protein [uncultured Bacteroides sp.]
MKNNKITTYILLLLSAGVWGIIAWRVYASLKDDTPGIQSVAKAPKKMKEDTIALLLNYRDPFLGDYPKGKTTIKEQKAKPVPAKQVNIQPQAEILPDFQYKGVIRLGKESQVIVSRNGENVMLKLKDKIGEFNVAEIRDDKLVVSCKGKKYDLPLQ